MPIVSLLVVIGVALLLVSICCCMAVQACATRDKAAASSPERRPAPLPAQRCHEALAAAINMARSGDFDGAYRQLSVVEAHAHTLASDLCLQATRCLVAALDSDYGSAGRRTVETVELLEARRRLIDTASSRFAYQVCQDAMRNLPLAKLGTGGFVASTFMAQANKNARRGNHDAALAQLGGVRDLLSQSMVLRHHPTLSGEIAKMESKIPAPGQKARAHAIQTAQPARTTSLQPAVAA